LILLEGNSTLGEDPLQRPLRSRFQARLTRSVRHQKFTAMAS
jgi:hypothetical protein